MVGLPQGPLRLLARGSAKLQHYPTATTAMTRSHRKANYSHGSVGRVGVFQFVFVGPPKKQYSQRTPQRHLCTSANVPKRCRVSTYFSDGGVGGVCTPPISASKAATALSNTSHLIKTSVR